LRAVITSRVEANKLSITQKAAQNTLRGFFVFGMMTARMRVTAQLFFT
jgi:hypothetical protein